MATNAKSADKEGTLGKDLQLVLASTELVFTSQLCGDMCHPLICFPFPLFLCQVIIFCFVYLYVEYYFVIEKLQLINIHTYTHIREIQCTYHKGINVCMHVCMHASRYARMYACVLVYILYGILGILHLSNQHMEKLRQRICSVHIPI